MLSKYYDLLNTSQEMEDENSARWIVGEIKKLYPEALGRSIYPGGTLGIFFAINIGNRWRFVKTHRNNEMQRQNLQKELDIMRKLYQGILDVDSFMLNVGEYQKLFVIMDFLQPVKGEKDIAFIQDMIIQYSANLSSVSYDTVNYNMNDFYKAAVQSYKVLTENNLLSGMNATECETSFLRFSEYASFETIICHGDLSNVNIMSDGANYFVIDWEDAMLGYQGYDLLYWLTFYSQRKYYDKQLLKKLNIDKQFGKDMMLMIILIKSYLSFQNKQYLKNKLSINDRISEIMQL